MKKSPLATVKERFNDKAGLIKAVRDLASEALWLDRVNEDKGLDRVSNAKLLHLHEVLSKVKADFGSRDKLVGEIAKPAIHYVLKPHPGPWLELFAKLLGRMPADNHVWIVAEGTPSFARFEGPLNPTGAVWRIELVSPRWPE